MKLVSTCTVLAMGLMAAACTPSGDVKDPSEKTTSGGKTEGGGLVGKPAPEIDAEFVSGNGAKSIKDSSGTVTIVDFWGTFCHPCKKSFPKLQEMADTQAGKLNVIAVSQDDTDTKKEEISKFGEETKVSFPIVWDKDKKTFNAYGKPEKMPTSVIVDKKGVVRFVHGGYTDEEAAVVSKEVEQLIAE
jgi:cytochrome c biogenesis protein CcmG, thiol:disulfide interchange protein DsbE